MRFWQLWSLNQADQQVANAHRFVYPLIFSGIYGCIFQYK